jgi:hypothetical protein
VSVAVPPGWPKQVPPAGSPDWEQKATAWLLDLSRAEYRGHPILRKHPAVLAWLVEQNLDAQLTAARHAYATARSEVGGTLAANVLTELLTALEADGAALLATQREVRLVGAALRGERYVPRL